MHQLAANCGAAWRAPGRRGTPCAGCAARPRSAPPASCRAAASPLGRAPAAAAPPPPHGPRAAAARGPARLPARVNDSCQARTACPPLPQPLSMQVRACTGCRQKPGSAMGTYARDHAGHATQSAPVLTERDPNGRRRSHHDSSQRASDLDVWHPSRARVQGYRLWHRRHPRAVTWIRSAAARSRRRRARASQPRSTACRRTAAAARRRKRGRYARCSTRAARLACHPPRSDVQRALTWCQHLHRPPCTQADSVYLQ